MLIMLVLKRLMNFFCIRWWILMLALIFSHSLKEDGSVPHNIFFLSFLLISKWFIKSVSFFYKTIFWQLQLLIVMPHDSEPTLNYFLVTLLVLWIKSIMIHVYMYFQPSCMSVCWNHDMFLLKMREGELFD